MFGDSHLIKSIKNYRAYVRGIWLKNLRIKDAATAHLILPLVDTFQKNVHFIGTYVGKETQMSRVNTDNRYASSSHHLGCF